VPGRVGDDEAALAGGEEPVGDVDGDRLLALGLQAVEEQRVVEPARLGAEAPRVRCEREPLVLEDRARLVQQPPDQRRLAIVDAAARDEPQQRRAQKYPSRFLRSIEDG
jgi:hypothetical protein